ncbi:MAG: ABC transporter permease subunit [Rhizobacter sp.]|nr:ABC transporter permease subunit [Bacteriovorax sp.]
MWLSYALIISGLILLLVGVWVYGLQKKDAYKFFYPAIVLFVLFSLVPISYSVYVSFTNLKTGHLLERKDVITLFENEKMIVKDSELLNFEIYKNQNDFLLVVDNLSGDFKKDDKVVKLGSTMLLPKGIVKLSKGEVLDMEDLKPDFKIIHPALGEYSFYRSDMLARIQPRYIRLGDGLFKDSITGQDLTEDKEDGQFKLAGESVGPGYFTLSGLKNYKELFFDPATKFVFLKSLTWTFTWAALSVLLTFSLGAFLAVVLNDLEGKSKFIYRMVFIIPYSIPFFISVLIFKGMLNKDFGEINTWLNALTISPVPWLENKMWAKVSVLMVNLWLGFPYMLLVITGIIQSIPKSIYEASSLEGATKFQNFRFLTFPLVLRAMVPLLIGSFAFNMNNFVGIYLLTGGGPVIPNVSAPIGETDILISYTYRLAFEGAQGQNFGMAAAVSMLIFFIVVILTVLNFRVSKLINK